MNEMSSAILCLLFARSDWAALVEKRLAVAPESVLAE